MLKQNVRYILAATKYLVSAMSQALYYIGAAVVTIIHIKIQSCRKLQVGKLCSHTFAS